MAEEDLDPASAQLRSELESSQISSSPVAKDVRQQRSTKGRMTVSTARSSSRLKGKERDEESANLIKASKSISQAAAQQPPTRASQRLADAAHPNVVQAQPNERRVKATARASGTGTSTRSGARKALGKKNITAVDATVEAPKPSSRKRARSTSIQVQEIIQVQDRESPKRVRLDNQPHSPVQPTRKSARKSLTANQSESSKSPQTKRVRIQEAATNGHIRREVTEIPRYTNEDDDGDEEEAEEDEQEGVEAEEQEEVEAEELEPHFLSDIMNVPSASVWNLIFSSGRLLQEYLNSRGRGPSHRSKAEICQPVNSITDICDTLNKYFGTGPRLDETYVMDDSGLDQIDKIVRLLKRELGKISTGDMDEQLVTQIYTYSFLDLAKLIHGAIRFHYSRGTLSEKQRSLESLQRIIPATIKFHNEVKKCSIKPDSSLVVLKRTIGLIQAVKKSDRALTEISRTLEAQRRREDQVLASQTRREQDLDMAEEAILLAVERDKKSRLRALYAYRQTLVDNPRDKLGKFSMYELEQIWSPQDHELDANGQPMERVPIFTARSMLDHIPGREVSWDLEWSEKERLCLLNAFSEFHGHPNLWQRLFLRCCRAGSLKNRTVGEMLKQAKYMRETFIESDRENDRPTEDYIFEIPDLDLCQLLE